ncbi:MAG: hypothetical protein JWP55_3032 [Mycobacterium sp.]|jgi:hypothetical protein|nr:hypothetical protein [Mycobacterium sp.]
MTDVPDWKGTLGERLAVGVVHHDVTIAMMPELLAQPSSGRQAWTETS